MIIQSIINLFLHIDANLAIAAQNYGFLIYPLLFLIIFLETGLVITPILPGDSLLFAAGALSSSGLLNIFMLFIFCSFAAIIGDTVNYWIGSFVGKSVFRKDSRFFKKEYLMRTRGFYERHGAKTIVIARFIPIIRTFAPFVAGIGRMSYPRFLVYNVVGGIVWVALFLGLGYFFGKIPIIQSHISLITLGIIVVSVIPILIELIRRKR